MRRKNFSDWSIPTAQEWMCAASESGNRSHPDFTQLRALGFSRSLAEAAADPWGRESLRSTSGWSDHCSEPAPISWICSGNHREAATAPGRAELYKELTGKAWLYFGKSTHFPCLPHFPSGALRAVSGQVKNPWKSQTRAWNSHTRAQEPLTDCNTPTKQNPKISKV